MRVGKLFAMCRKPTSCSPCVENRRDQTHSRSPDSFDVHHLENAFATGAAESTSWRPLDAMRGRRNIFRRVTHSMMVAVTLLNAPCYCRSVCTRPRQGDTPLGSSVTQSWGILWYLPPGEMFCQPLFARFREISLGHVYTCVYFRRAKHAFAAFGGLYCKQIQ